MPIYLQSTLKGGITFHAGLAEYKKQGVIFAASGGTGKSTCCRRLPSHWSTLCDDETLVVLDKNNIYKAHPFPTWSDYLFKRAKNRWDIQHSVKLSSLFFIEQSSYDKLIPIDITEVSMFITEASVQVWERLWLPMDKSFRIKLTERIFNNAFDMARNISAFRLCLCLSGNFWEKIERQLDTVDKV